MSEPDESSGFKPGDRVEVFEVPGGYLVAPAGTLDESVARRIADAATPVVDPQSAEDDVRISWEQKRRAGQ